MSDTSTIEWTEATWNPVTGCTRISAGCANCYIERTMPFRISGRRFSGPQIGASTGILLHPERLSLPPRWRRPRRVFVNSLSDLFHRDVPAEFIAEVFTTMASTPRHTYQLLTKRPGRMRSLLTAGRLEEQIRAGGHAWPLRNLWLGVSCENQATAALRIPLLLDTPAWVRWVSCEPLLGAIALDHADRDALCDGGLDWVVAGGESGPGARPVDPGWVRSLRDQCAAAPRTAFYFKQWGGRTAKTGGRELDGRTWDEYPIAEPELQRIVT
jgi:protein gp37